VGNASCDWFLAMIGVVSSGGKRPGGTL